MITIDFNELSLDEVNTMLEEIKMLENGHNMNPHWLCKKKFSNSGYLTFRDFEEDLIYVASCRMKNAVSLLVRRRPYDFIK